MLLQSFDTNWRDHLAALDYLRQGIHLRGYAQKQPKQEYKREAFELFRQLIDQVKNEVTRVLMTVRIAVARAAGRGRRGHGSNAPSSICQRAPTPRPSKPAMASRPPTHR